MSESERRHGYRERRVLIETARILNPQFPDAIVSLSGAQIEMLRNITQYLNRQNTFVTTYGEGYYLSPTTEEWDDLQAIVASLERELMGNGNILWGFNARWFEKDAWVVVGGGAYTLSFDPCPEGYVYVLEGITCLNQDTAGTCTTSIDYGANDHVVEDTFQLSANVYHAIPMIRATLEEGDYVKIEFKGCAAMDVVVGTVRGYMMQI